MTIKELDEIEAQLDSTVPYYLPRLVQACRVLLSERARLEGERDQLRDELDRLAIKIAEGERDLYYPPETRTEGEEGAIQR